MARVPEGASPSELTIIARRVLLDAVEALAEQVDAVVLVGAQAVYLRTQDADLSTQVYTADGDLALDPKALADEPRLELAMRFGRLLPTANCVRTTRAVGPDREDRTTHV